MIVMKSSNSSNKSNKTSSKNNDDVVAPNLIARQWVRLYRMLPVINFPGTHLDISFTLFAAAFLWASRLAFYQISVKVFDWPTDKKETDIAPGDMVSAWHSSLLLPGLIVALTTQRYRPTEHISKTPQWWQDLVSALLQFCTGYMVSDGFVTYFIVKGVNHWVASDYLFLGHHVVTTVYMTQTRVLQAGHISAMCCMLLGEVTNPLHNMHLVANQALELDCCNGERMLNFHRLVTIGFAYSYFWMRTLVGPLFMLHLTADLLFSKTRDNVPFWIRLSWILMIWTVVFGSYDLVMDCWNTIQKFRSESEEIGNEYDGIARPSAEL